MNLRQVRKKIRSVSNVQKITRAMEMISAIKMKKAQQLALDNRPYNDHLEDIIKKITSKLEIRSSLLLKEQTNQSLEKKNLAIVISSNKGLCGGFNISLFRFISRNVDFEKTDFVIIGKKATFLSKLGGKIIADFSSNYPLNNVSAIYSFALDKYLKEDYSQVTIYFNRFINVLKYEPIKKTILPVKLKFLDNFENNKNFSPRTEYLFEPPPERIIDDLLNSYLQQIIQNSIIESEASEHSARMIAMKNANENAGDVIYNLTLLRNKIRQQTITYELLDMIGAKISVEDN